MPNSKFSKWPKSTHIATFIMSAGLVLGSTGLSANASETHAATLDTSRFVLDNGQPESRAVVGTLILLSILKKEKERKEMHEAWCNKRYRSYEAKSDTFQPFNGDRRKCVSPHSRKSRKK